MSINFLYPNISELEPNIPRTGEYTQFLSQEIAEPNQRFYSPPLQDISKKASLKD